MLIYAIPRPSKFQKNKIPHLKNCWPSRGTRDSGFFFAKQNTEENICTHERTEMKVEEFINEGLREIGGSRNTHEGEMINPYYAHSRTYTITHKDFCFCL